jgi:signal transduction histidine kinase/ActR/RegA family two-component response regulator
LRITFRNKAAEDLLGDHADCILPLNPDPPNSAPSSERVIQTSRGESRRVEVSISALKVPAGGAVACLHDVTELRTLEEQYRQSQKLESIGQLAGGVAHDFNNLLTVINGYGYMLRADAIDPELRAGLDAILQAGERAAGLTGQLLAFSRKQILQPTILDLNMIVSGLEPMVRRVIGEQISVLSSLSPSLAGVRADAGQIEQVILNLAVNARDAMPEGGTLLFETADTYLDEHEAKLHSRLEPGPYVMLAVSDTGIGMDEATRIRIFEPFFTTKPVGKGTGLGLATVYGIVRQSGGHIGVYSVPGKGTSFKLYFPRVDGLPTETQTVSAAAKGGTERILLAEDEVGVRALATRVLTENGYRVWPASNGAEARQIAAAHQNEIDLLLTDVVMPDITGPRLAGQLLKLRPKLRVLYTSGYTDKAIVHNGELEEGVSFLPKPFTPAVLLNAIRQVLDA